MSTLGQQFILHVLRGDGTHDIVMQRPDPIGRRPLRDGEAKPVGDDESQNARLGGGGKLRQQGLAHL
ncbi:MAG: hypothetical protein WCP99_05480, partial [Burkholderiales bacterium]